MLTIKFHALRKEQVMRNLFFALGVVFFLSSAGNGYGQIDRSGEVKTLMAGLDSGSSSQRINTAKLITRSGIVDEALYEKVAALLKAGYSEGYEKNHVDEMSWLCKALAASGDPQYKALLTEVAEQAPSGKLQHYAKQSISLIAEYADRSQILNSTELLDPEFSVEENRLAHMLKSEKIGLKRDAAKMIVRSIGVHNRIYDFAAAELEEMLSGAKSDILYMDTMAWLCKVLASSGNVKFAETLKKVIAETEDPNLSRHASDALTSIH